jgi:hypothetical protein
MKLFETFHIVGNVVDPPSPGEQKGLCYAAGHEITAYRDAGELYRTWNFLEILFQEVGVGPDSNFPKALHLMGSELGKKGIERIEGIVLKVTEVRVLIGEAEGLIVELAAN